MTTFHHGGRLGDAIYALYTVKALGGGHVVISDFHDGTWNPRSLLSLLKHQPYITGAEFFPYSDEMAASCTYDLHEAEDDNNPEEFPEWHGGDWPGNIHLAKRYAVHFGIDWHPNQPWLTAPRTKNVDVVFHAPKRRVTDEAALSDVLHRLVNAGLEVRVLGGPEDYAEWYRPLWEMVCIQPENLLEAADYINSAKVFFGAVSSCHAIAEGLEKPRYVQQAPGCDNVTPTGSLNGLSADQIYSLITKHL